MGKNKSGFYNYKVTIYNNRDRTDIKEERLFKERKELVNEYGMSISTITKMCNNANEYIHKYIYYNVEKINIPLPVENLISSL